ncbi:hypothetical protein GCM10025868_21720 [Angustibacter aerolatus]|uniref:Ketoreductase (KR) domain-containing protein n=1 Tax=Angustibacter aerolatus TaxID=1162965 RepID=A0ABQ6JFD9_9ACTN|nr:hypothetical protein GCM10025868_21720 [Angustibacter aerolatus]
MAWSDDPAATAATVDDVRTAGGSAEEVRADVTDADRLAALVAQVGARHGRLDVLVHATAHEAPAEGATPTGSARSTPRCTRRGAASPPRCRCCAAAAA